ncbi:ADP-ribosylation factor GTPase-activating protein 2 isoform X2 [Macrosteles quadrilineatus]|uniref:ADP-ribosylation factor GTPase-activating protein 2 isoform X2 n=1 Tax=Macrosteles quadrilineatus TaxID=74068 RepID=UPI0023E2C78D|nr:ADP-ribosylation factor GTPase-activating protein 2 isoform X2 [Macrosteles quadrilineatus]
MSDESPNNNDIQLIFKKLRAIPTNKSCFDCNAKLPTWSSVTYGVFICIDCSAVHRSLGVHLTFVRSTQLDTNWTWLQLRQMQLGGNANAESFFRQHNCVTTDAQQKYNSRAAQLYREKLHTAAVHAMRIHGTKLEISPREVSFLLGRASLHIEPSHEHQTSKEEKKEEVDFFAEHSTESQFNYDNQNLNVDNRSTNGNVTTASKPMLPPGAGPNVEAALSNVVEPQADRKSIIGGRKPPAKKTGLGAKRGLGAQRVKADFSAIEREAELADQLKAQEKTPVVPEKSPDEQEAQMVSMRLAYQDISQQQKKEEEKLKTTDPKKAQQVERLGMGFSTRSGVSHSAFTSIKRIEQESPVKTSNSRYTRDDDDTGYDEFFDAFSSTSMLKGNRTPTESSTESFFDNKMDGLSVLESISNRNTPKGSSGWGESSGGGWGEPKSKGWRESINDADWEEKKPAKKEWEEPERRQPATRNSERSAPKTTPSPSSGEAQKKFGTAKAISSDQYFADSGDTSWERKTNLSRFEGSSSISSADYFNRTEVLPGGGYGVQTPDLDDVKESVRQGVTKVAGKLSSLANGVMSSFQEKYGGY